ncbi:MAG TPA: hypothetical protein VGE45_19895 [Chloroflexia bacterium]|jgi:hypothetical protein
MGPIEGEEFDPTVYPAEYITVEVEEEIQSILERVDEAWGRTPNVVLVIPRGAHAFNTTHDFLSLGKLQGAREVRVSIASLDPTIAGLARVLGFHMVDPPAGHPILDDMPGMEESRRADVEKPTSPLPLMGYNDRADWVIAQATPTYAPSSLTTSAWLNNPGEAALHDSGRLDRSPTPSQPLVRPGMPPPRTRQRQTGQLSSALITDSSLPALVDEDAVRPHVSPTPSGRIKARTVLVPADGYRHVRGLRYSIGTSKPVRWGRIFAVVLALLVVSLAGAGAYAYVYLPEGKIAVAPRSKPITSVPVEIAVLTSSSQGGTVGTAAPPHQTGPSNMMSAPSVPAIPVQAQIVEEGTRPATGTRQVAKGRGTGTVRFTNRLGSPIAVPANLQLKAANGVVVQVTQAGTVPATIFGSTFGTLDLPVAATIDGPDGNIGAGELSGIWNGQLNYYNNAAFQGGTIETIKVVTQEDIDAVVADLRGRAEGRVPSAVQEKVAAGQQLITQTRTLANATFVADRKAGEDGEMVSVRLTAEARAYVVEESALQDSVMQAVRDWVQENIPTTAGATLDTRSVQFTPPTIQSVELEQGRVVYVTSAEAQVSFSLTPDLANQIRELVKGQEVEQARSLISQSKYGDYVAPLAIEAKVLWFDVGKLPDDPARIEVEAGGR